MVNIKDINITTEMLAQIAEIDEFKGSWTGFEIIQPEQLKTLKKISTIESIGSLTLQKQKRYLEEKIQKMIKEGSQQSKPLKQPVEDSFPDSALTRNQKLILDLFNKVSELDASEIAERLNMNSDTVKKNLKSLTVSGYIIKYGSTKGAWYKKRQPM